MNWFAWAVLSAAFAALAAVLVKLGVAKVDPDAATLVRAAVTLAIISVALLVTGRWGKLAEVRSPAAAWLVASGVAAAASWMCYTRALQVGTVGQVAPVDKFSVVIAALLAVAVLGERPDALEWLGLALVTVGVVVLGVAAGRG